jgi:hypothetical protein
MNITTLSPQQLRKAADIQEKIQSLQKELSQILGASGPADTAPTEAPARKKVSPAGRARMRAAQIARWAKIKGTAPEAKPVQKAKRKFSAQALANIRAGVAKRLAAKGKAPATKQAKKAKRKFSAQALANIRAGVAKRLAAKGKAPAAKPATKAKRTFSAAHKAALVAAQKARWAKAKAAEKAKL